MTLPLAGRGPADFAGWLRAARRRRGWSQLQLAHETGVSHRHVSFLETGRSRPSRPMVLRLAGGLDASLAQRNRALLAAGFAPLYSETPLEDPGMEGIRNAVDFLLRAHEPYPAFVLDGRWNIQRGNRIHHEMLRLLLPRIEGPVNALRLLLDPAQLRPHVANWASAVRSVLRRVDRQIESLADETLIALRDELLDLPGVEEARREGVGRDEPAARLLVPLELRFGDATLSWMSALASFGTPLDVTLQELVIESLLPADEATRRFAHDFAGSLEESAPR